MTYVNGLDAREDAYDTIDELFKTLIYVSSILEFFGLAQLIREATDRTEKYRAETCLTT